MLNRFDVDLFLEYFVINIFEKRLLASKHIIIPRIKIDKIKTYWWLKLIKINKDNKINDYKDLKTKNHNFWKISDEDNVDQLKAVVGVCFMFGALILMGLYSNFL